MSFFLRSWTVTALSLSSFFNDSYRECGVPSAVGPSAAVEFSCTSADDWEEGYPGAVNAKVTYSPSDANELRLDYHCAVSGLATPINLTNHSYFNLAGHVHTHCVDFPGVGGGGWTRGGGIACHEAILYADEYLPTDKDCLVTGEILPVAGTPWDFRELGNMGNRIKASDGGFDNTFVVRGYDQKTLKPAAKLVCPKSGLTLETETTCPGVHLYTANFLNHKGKGGAAYPAQSSFCLETQGFPDAVNHDNFPSTIVNPGGDYKHSTLYRLSCA